MSKKITEDMQEAYDEFISSYGEACDAAKDAQYNLENINSNAIEDVDDLPDIDLNNVTAEELEEAISRLTRKQNEIEGEQDTAQSYLDAVGNVYNELEQAVDRLNDLLEALSNAGPEVEVGDIVKVDETKIQVYRVIHIHGEWALCIPMMDPYSHNAPIVATCEDLILVESASEAA